MALKHPAVEAVARIEDGDVSGAVEVLARRERAELRYILGETTDAFTVEDDDVYSGDGNLTKDDLVGLCEFVAEVHAAQNEGGD